MSEEVSNTAAFMQVHSEEYKNNYDQLIEMVCNALWDSARNQILSVVNENGEKVSFNMSDVCNVLTNVVQKFRASYEHAQQA